MARQGHLFKNRGRLMTSHSEFMKVTCDRYGAMKQRFENWRDNAYPPMTVPFTLEEFREFVIWTLGGEQGTTRCEYCNQPIDLLRLQFDHRLPPDRGGSLGFSNLAPCDEQCNQQKGFMSAVAFMHLLELVSDPKKFGPIDRTNVLGRLQSQFKLAKRVRALQKKPRQDALGRKVDVVPHRREAGGR